MKHNHGSILHDINNGRKTSLTILIAEDEEDIASSYKLALEARNHHVVTTRDGEECLEEYKSALEMIGSRMDNGHSHPPFDVVLIDYRLPKMDGMQTAKKILEMNPNQRIIFASAYVKESLMQTVQMLGQILEFMQKPFLLASLIGTIEDAKVWQELVRINGSLREEGFDATEGQIAELLQGLNKIQKGRDYLFEGLKQIEQTTRMRSVLTK